MGYQNVISGHAFGIVDWFDEREAGFYLQGGDGRKSRVVVEGREITRILANNAIKKGHSVTASGVPMVRMRGEQPILVYQADQVVVEPRDQRVGNCTAAVLKGVVLYWDPEREILKTFFNEGSGPSKNSVVCSIKIQNYLAGMGEAARERFKASLRHGREFMTQASAEASSYKTNEGPKPVLQLLAHTFQLLG